jgi:uncharacterized protein YjbI with pentapeptide repeats
MMKTAREEFLRMYAAGERNFAGTRLLQYGRGIDLSGVVLRDINFCGADLSEICLDSSELTGADLRGAMLQNARLCNAVLRDVNLMGACLDSAIFHQATLDNVDLCNVNALNAVFTEARMRKVRLERAIFIYANFQGAKEIDSDKLFNGSFRRRDAPNFIYRMTMPDGTCVEDWDWDIWG